MCKSSNSPIDFAEDLAYEASYVVINTGMFFVQEPTYFFAASLGLVILLCAILVITWDV
jgi:hypothetical protein